MDRQRVQTKRPSDDVARNASYQILFLYDPELGHVTAHLRGFLFHKPLEQRGWQVQFLNVRTATAEDVVHAARQADIIYLLKVASLQLVERIRAEAPTARLVFDLTDALWQPVHRRCGWRDLEAILIQCAAIFSENEAICAFGRRFSNHVFPIPPCTRGEAFAETRSRITLPPRKIIRIGWMGSAGTIGAITAIASDLARIGAAYGPVELRLLGCPAAHPLPPMPGITISTRPQYDEAAMMEEVLQFDLGLFPPPGDREDYAVRGALKAMLYMTAGIPPVALRMGDCATLITDGQTGLLVDDRQDWCTAIARLVRDAPLRQAIGRRARAAVEREHSLDAVTAVLDQALHAVLALRNPR